MKRVIKLDTVSDLSGQFLYDYGYDKGPTIVKYNAVMDNFRAEIKARQLKPLVTYQVKLVGIPECAGGNDETNELIGYSGRWYCPDCDGTTAGKNRSDYQYETNNGNECIHGYLVFDYFTTDIRGAINTTVESDESFHVLYCSDMYFLDTNLQPFTEEELKCQSPQLCNPEDVWGQIERPEFAELSEGHYQDVKIALTEESFHQNCGTWTTVLENNLEFTIQK